MAADVDNLSTQRGITAQDPDTQAADSGRASHRARTGKPHLPDGRVSKQLIPLRKTNDEFLNSKNL